MLRYGVVLFTSFYGLQASSPFRPAFANPLQTRCVNACGYATVPLREGSQCVSPQFVSLLKVEGKDGIHLTDLTFDFGENTKIGGELMIQRLNKDGNTTDMWCYYMGARSPHKTDGWYKMGDPDVLVVKGDENDAFFPAGEGLYLSALPGMKITTSGEVLLQKTTVTFKEDGNMMLSNPYPVPLKLLDIELTFNGDTKIGGEVMIQRLDKDGNTTQMWCYYMGARSPHKTDGWYKMGDEDILVTTDNQPTFDPGEALYFGAKTDYTVTINPPTVQ